jgi:hypothetical protein
VEGPELHVRLEVVEDLEVSEETELGEVEHWLASALELLVAGGLRLLGVLREDIAIDLDNALLDEVHLLDVTVPGDDGFAIGENSAIKGNNDLIAKSSFAGVEEMVESFFKFYELLGAEDEVGLHLGGDLLVELELFDDQVEVVHEGLLHVLPDVPIERGLDVVGFVGLLNLLDPHVERVQLLLNQIFETILGAENGGNRPH